MTVVLHGDRIVDDVHLTQCSGRCKEEIWLSSVELIWMNYKRLDLLGRGYIRSCNDTTRLVVQPV